MNTEHTISVIPADSSTRSLIRPVKINIDDLSNNVKEFVDQIGEVLKSIPDSCENFELAEFEFNAEVSAKGALSLLGSGGELAGKGGLKFVFRRTPRKP